MGRQPKDRTGERFGAITVIEIDPSYEKGSGGVRWVCECDCGKRFSMRADTIQKRKNRDCGCKIGRSTEISKVPIDKVRAEDCVGKRFDRLVVTEMGYQIHTGGKNRCACKVRCDCGMEFVTLKESLDSGNTKSCGCVGSAKKAENTDRRARSRKMSSDVGHVLSVYKSTARKKGHEWSLNVEDFCNLIAGDCHYCGDSPKERTTKFKYDTGFRYNGIDRAVNSEGYTRENCVSCCWTCNNKKSDTDYAEFCEWVVRVAENVRGKKPPHVNCSEQRS